MASSFIVSREIVLKASIVCAFPQNMFDEDDATPPPHKVRRIVDTTTNYSCGRAEEEEEEEAVAAMVVPLDAFPTTVLSKQRQTLMRLGLIIGAGSRE